MTSRQIVAFSLAVAAIMSVFVWLVTPVNAQPVCWTQERFVSELGKNPQLTSKYIEGETFDQFVDQTIQKYGMPPSGKRPKAAYLVSANNRYTLYFVTQDNAVCDRLNVVASTAHGLMKSSLSTPI